IFTGDILPRRLTLVRAEIDFTLRITRLEKYAPAVFGHLHVAELGPAVRLDANGGTQIDVVGAAFTGSHVEPPAQKSGLPGFQSALQHAVAAQVHVVGNFFGVINHDHLLADTAAPGPRR